MTESSLAALLARRSPVDLASLNSVAELMTRRDRKYVVPMRDAMRFVGLVPEAAQILAIDGRRSFQYVSVYFDTPDLASYHAAARRRPHRYKVRTRAYLDSGCRLLEIKLRDARGRTVKQRVEHGAARGDVLDDASLTFLSDCPLIGEDGAALRPVLRTEYQRSTLLLDRSVRVTIDLDVRATTPDGRTVRLVDMAVIETKSHRAPSTADRLLWELGYRPVPISKFCTGLAALQPDLPANRWTRALRQPWTVTAAAGWPHVT